MANEENAWGLPWTAHAHDNKTVSLAEAQAIASAEAAAERALISEQRADEDRADIADKHSEYMAVASSLVTAQQSIEANIATVQSAQLAADATLADVNTALADANTALADANTALADANAALAAAGGGSGGGMRRILDRDRGGPPAGPTEGDTYIVRSVPAPTGAWVGQGGKLARWSGSAWTFETPANGTVVLVVDENRLLSWDGTTWDSFIKVGNPGGVSVAEFGAYPNNTDSLTEIQAAQTYARANGLRLIFPYVNSTAYYLVSSPIVVTERDHIEGAGAWSATAIRYTGECAFRIDGRRAELSGFYIHGASSTHPEKTAVLINQDAGGSGQHIEMVKLSRMWFVSNKYNIRDRPIQNIAQAPQLNTAIFEDLIDTGRSIGIGAVGLRLQNVSGSINLSRVRFNQALPEVGPDPSWAMWITGGGGVFMDNCSAIGGFDKGSGIKQGGIYIEQSSVFTAHALNIENVGGPGLWIDRGGFAALTSSHIGATNGDLCRLTDTSAVRINFLRLRGNRFSAAEAQYSSTARGLVVDGATYDAQISGLRIWETASHAIEVGSGAYGIELHNPVIARRLAAPKVGGSGIYNRSPDLTLRGGLIQDCDGYCIDSNGGLNARDVRLAKAAPEAKFYTLGAGDILENWREMGTSNRWNSYGPEIY